MKTCYYIVLLRKLSFRLQAYLVQCKIVVFQGREFFMFLYFTNCCFALCMHNRVAYHAVRIFHAMTYLRQEQEKQISLCRFHETLKPICGLSKSDMQVKISCADA